jgi:tetratricopeptide (TPR) repeat protein
LLVDLDSGPEPVYRFRHALIQEATYKGLARDERRRLHARAAWGLEEAWAGRLGEVAGELGRHQALADEKERAAYYLEMAGDRAATAFANDEAVASYKWALELLGRDPGSAATAMVEMRLKLGRIFWVIGRYREARAAFREARDAVPPGSEVLAAQCHYWLGNLAYVEWRLDDAAAAFDAGEHLLQAVTDTGSDDWMAVWLDIQLYLAVIWSARNQPDREDEVHAAVRPFVEARGTPAQKVNFCFQLADQRYIAARGRVDDVTLASYRTAWALIEKAGLDNQMTFAALELGVALLGHDDIAEASVQLTRTLSKARRAGDRSLEMRCLAWLACAHLRQHDVDAVRPLALAAGDVARTFPHAGTGMVTALLGELEAAVQVAISAWDDGQRGVASQLLGQGVRLAEKLGRA